jgi:hypothetical protein
MLKAVFAILVTCLPAFVAVPIMEPKPSGPTAAYPVPEGGGVSGDIYHNAYFGFRYRLPANWAEDVEGPPPSTAGYYSLAALKPRDSLAATLLIAAQDNFFINQNVQSATDFLNQVKRQLDPALSAGASLQTEIAGQSFARLDYAGAGLHHTLLATEIRCHTLIFSVTSRSLEQIESVVASLNKITFTAGDSRWPICVPEYATADHVIHRVEPQAAGPRFSSVPTRIIIGADGKVEQVHPIGALPEQAKSIQGALSQWQFRPYVLNGNRVTVETGLTVQFSTGQQ